MNYIDCVKEINEIKISDMFSREEIEKGIDFSDIDSQDFALVREKIYAVISEVNDLNKTEIDKLNRLTKTKLQVFSNLLEVHEIVKGNSDKIESKMIRDIYIDNLSFDEKK